MRRKTKNRLGLAALIILALLGLWRSAAQPEIGRAGLLAAMLLAAAFALAVRRRLLRPRPAPGVPDGFADQPWRFDGATLELNGEVQRVMSDSAAEGLRRWLVDKLRNLTGSTKTSYRYSHQRFLVRSPALRRGQTLLVEHNVRYGRIELSPGAEVALRGEYIHKTFGGRYFYGRVHKTHPPKGYLRRA